MAVRTGYVGTESVGDVLTATNFNKLPNGMIGYASVTANQTGITSSVTDLTSLSVAVTVGSSRMIWIVGSVEATQNTSTGNAALYIRESSTTLNFRNVTMSASTNAGLYVVYFASAPSSGSHTYKLSMSTDAGTVDLKASSTQPAFIAVFDHGVSF